MGKWEMHKTQNIINQLLTPLPNGKFVGNQMGNGQLYNKT